MLIIVPTPIGNLKDITLRALEALKNCDGVICEDSRHTGLLLHQYEIKKPMLVLNDNNEARSMLEIISRLQTGANLVLVSDAGTPLISDPGYKLIRDCIANNIPVDSLPGASSILPALTLSGLPPDKFMFLGYLPEKPGHRAAMLNKLKEINSILKTTYIAFVAPHKLIKTLDDLNEIYGNIDIVLAKELTKIFQSVKTLPVLGWLEELKKKPPKGEFILLFSLESTKIHE